MQQSEGDGLQRTAMDLRANLADAQGRCGYLLSLLCATLCQHMMTKSSCSCDLGLPEGRRAPCNRECCSTRLLRATSACVFDGEAAAATMLRPAGASGLSSVS